MEKKPGMLVHVLIFYKTDRELGESVFTGGADGFMAAQHMNAVAVSAVMDIHHNKILLTSMIDDFYFAIG